MASSKPADGTRTAARSKAGPKKGGNQANAFAVAKQNALGKLDKSPKGSLDLPIAALVHAINRHPDLVTTSSCSGRVVLFQSLPGRAGKWLLCSHATVTLADVSAALGSSDAEASDAGALIALKMEPAILHVQCRDVETAKWLLQLAVRCGFRESGLVLSGSNKVSASLRHTIFCSSLAGAHPDSSCVCHALCDRSC
jgi:tRNA wybutosine-synthesizing protein 3